jgi:STE24 endopeptidase
MSDIAQPTITPEAVERQTPSPIQPATIDLARQRRAYRYACTQHWLDLIDLVAAGGLLAVIAFAGLALRLRDWLMSQAVSSWQPIAGWAPVCVAVVIGCFFIVYAVLTSPLAFIGGYVLPHHYGLSRQRLGRWLLDQTKTLALTLCLVVFLSEILYMLLASQPLTWWLWLASGLLLFNIVYANLLPVLILPIFYKQTPLPEGDLRQRLLAMAKRAHTRVRGVYVMNLSDKTEQGNAVVMGLGNTRRIVIGDTILREYSPDEIEVVLAHELGHHVHHDIWKNIALATALTVCGLVLLDAGLQFAVQQPSWGLHGMTDVAALPMMVAIFGVYGFLTGPITNLFSRRQEMRADQYALDVTCNPVAFISAFNRLANQNLARLDPPPLVEFLFYTHPSIGRRIRLAQRWQATHKTQAGD